MRFRTSQTSSHLDSRRQRRMLGYVAVIAVVLVAFQLLPQARRPPENGAEPGAKPSPDEMDFRVQRESGRRLEPDEFMAPPELDPPRTPAPAGIDAPTMDAQDANPRLDRSVLETVKDNTLGIRADESDAFFYVLDHVRRVPTGELERTARQGVQYVNLMSDPSLYRGELVTVTGDLWRLYEFPASDNRYGLTRLYEGWIFTSDSSTHPYRIVATELGEGLQPGANLRTPVRVTGYFFKREGYQSQGGLHVAPTLLARTIERYRSPNAPPPADDLAPIMLGVVVAIGLILSVTLFSFAWSDRRNPRQATKLPSISTETVRRLEELDTRSVSEHLRELADRERAAEFLSSTASEPISAEANGQARRDDQYVELPTPFPPTRGPERP